MSPRWSIASLAAAQARLAQAEGPEDARVPGGLRIGR
jgi:hypothetical protein